MLFDNQRCGAPKMRDMAQPTLRHTGTNERIHTYGSHSGTDCLTAPPHRFSNRCSAAVGGNGSHLHCGMNPSTGVLGSARAACLARRRVTVRCPRRFMVYTVCVTLRDVRHVPCCATVHGTCQQC